jgi:hypothetical protein
MAPKRVSEGLRTVNGACVNIPKPDWKVALSPARFAAAKLALINSVRPNMPYFT